MAKVPQKIKLLDDLPKGRSGKVIISEVKEKYFNATKNNNIDLITKKIFEIASENFLVPIEQVNEKSTPDTISSWDSLGHLEFIALLEEGFNITFNTSEMLQIENMEDTIKIIKGKL